MTLFELKEKLATLNAQIKADADWIAQKAADPAVPMEEINAKKDHRDELVIRRDLLQAQHDEVEAQQKNALKDQYPTGNLEKDDMIKAKAAFYKTALTGGDTSSVRKEYEGLGALPANSSDLGRGENLLPTNMETELITEPFETNSLRDLEQVSQITGLEEPKISFTIDDASLADVLDTETAKEIEMEGDTVSYGRFKTKVTATVKDTVFHGTPTNLVTTIENALKGGLALKEKMRAFDASPHADHRHMSFYSNNIKAVAGDNMVDAILKALGDLPDAFGENAAVVMRKVDYYSEINKLANNSATLWGKKPEDVIGYPVVFNDKAIVPVIGDFRYARLNYDIGTIFETDKDAKKGEYYFVLTAWGDHRIKLASAFRTAFVRRMLIGATAVADTTPPKAGDKLTVDSLVFNDGWDAASGTGITYQWEYLNGTTWENASHGDATTNELQTVDTGADDGKSFRCKVTYQDANGPASVVFTNAIEKLANA